MSATPRPQVRYRINSLPDELKQLPRWITFDVIPGRNGKLDKFPLIAGTRTKAKCNDSSTWRTFEEALTAAEAQGLWLGFAFTPDLDLTFIDFDGVLGAGGVVKSYAQLVIDQLDSYTEASVSGNGVHVIVRGRPPEGFTKDRIAGKVEVYPSQGGRFALLTGDTRPGLGSMDGFIEERSRELAGFFPPMERRQAAPVQQNGASAARLSENDLRIIVDALRPSRVAGQMHELDLAVAGILLKNGVEEDQARQIVGELSDQEAKALAAVRDTYARAGGINVRGYQALRELIPAGALAAIDGTLQPYFQAQQPKLVTPGRSRVLLAGDNTPDVQLDRFPEPPPEVYHGWFSGYVELVENTTEAPNQFHLASALTIIGAYAGRNVYTKLASGRVYPNNYTVLTGNSSESKKDTAMKRAWDMAVGPESIRERTALPYVEKGGVASAESFIKGLTNQSNVVIRMSEFSEVLANARRKGTTTILTMLMKAWDTPPQLSNDSLTNPAMAINPFVSVLAGTQPEVLAADLIGSDITSGFANRIMFVPGSGKGHNSWPDEVDELKLHAHWVKVRANLRAYGIDEYIPVNRTPEVIELWDQFYCAPRGETAIERTMSQRHQILVLKVALIFAISDCYKTIEHVHLARAIVFVNWMWEALKPLISGWATSNDNRLEQRIMEVLRQTGPIKRRILWHKSKNPRWSANDFARLVRSMTDNGTIAMNEEGLIGIVND